MNILCSFGAKSYAQLDSTSSKTHHEEFERSCELISDFTFINLKSPRHLEQVDVEKLATVPEFSPYEVVVTIF